MLFLAAAGALNVEPLGNWSGNYPPCDQHTELLKRGHMNVGVRFSTSNPVLAAEFARAMDFWAAILEMDWHEENSRNCAMQIVDGRDWLFQHAQVARAQFPEAALFQGWIAFNPRVRSVRSDLFRTAVHEIGHLLGLGHSANASSVMYFLRLDGPLFLDGADLAALAARHKLRLRAAPCDLLPVSVQSSGSR
jgi:hypothetical protein